MIGMRKVPLMVSRIIRIAGGVIYKDGATVMDIQGGVSAKVLPTSKRMYLLAPGAYLVQWATPKPEPFPLDFYLDQSTLHKCGASLSLNLEPFTGLLQVFYPMQIEEDSMIADIWLSTSSCCPEDCEEILTMEENFDG
jgi:hypothetical protein